MHAEVRHKSFKDNKEHWAETVEADNTFYTRSSV